MAFPENGSTYILNGFGDSFSGTSTANSLFGLYSVDLAEFSTLYKSPWAVEFIGYKADGTTVRAEFVTDGIIDGSGPLADFETFYFSDSFSDLVRFEVPNERMSLDNLVVIVPEPGSASLLVVGALAFWQARRRGRKPSPNCRASPKNGPVGLYL